MAVDFIQMYCVIKHISLLFYNHSGRSYIHQILLLKGRADCMMMESLSSSVMIHQVGEEEEEENKERIINLSGV